VIPQHGEPELRHGSGNGGRRYGKRVLVRIVLNGLSGAFLELFCGGLRGGMNECTAASIEGFGEFEILWAQITCESVRDQRTFPVQARGWGWRMPLWGG